VRQLPDARVRLDQLLPQGLRVRRELALPAYEQPGRPQFDRALDDPGHLQSIVAERLGGEDLERERPRHRLFGHLVSVDPPMHEDLGIGGDRPGHRDAGRDAARSKRRTSLSLNVQPRSGLRSFTANDPCSVSSRYALLDALPCTLVIGRSRAPR
jgi:hypothetical protein